jgi:hypothetical protein
MTKKPEFEGMFVVKWRTQDGISKETEPLPYDQAKLIADGKIPMVGKGLCEVSIHGVT